MHPLRELPTGIRISREPGRWGEAAAVVEAAEAAVAAVRGEAEQARRTAGLERAGLEREGLLPVALLLVALLPVALLPVDLLRPADLPAAVAAGRPAPGLFFLPTESRTRLSVTSAPVFPMACP
jgi:hypothetical protein